VHQAHLRQQSESCKLSIRNSKLPCEDSDTVLSPSSAFTKARITSLTIVVAVSARDSQRSVQKQRYRLITVAISTYRAAVHCTCKIVANNLARRLAAREDIGDKIALVIL
jgi:hypothetical protein